MRSAAAVLTLFAVCICTAGFAQVVMEDYPISIATVANPAGPVGSTIQQVNVHTAGGAFLIDNFMKAVVPAALAANGVLPAPANAATANLKVVIPAPKSGVIDSGPLHPVWLRVRAERPTGVTVKERKGEKFEGKVCDPGCWKFWSYFVTRYCAVARVDKVQKTAPVTAPAPAPIVPTATIYNWIDP